MGGMGSGGEMTLKDILWGKKKSWRGDLNIIRGRSLTGLGRQLVSRSEGITTLRGGD